MSGAATLGEAQVAIRATLDKLDGDLNNAKSKIGSVMGGVAKTLGGIGAAGFGAFGMAAGGAVTAIAGVGVALGNMAKDAAQIEGLKNAFESLAGQAGTTGDEMLAAMQKGSGGTVAARDLMTSFNKAASLVSVEFASELPDAMDLVSKAAAATGQDMGFLMDSLVTGVGRVSPMILDNLGIQVSLTEATEKYAEANGVAASSLSKTEQQAAVQALTMEKLKEKYGDMDSVYDTAGAKMQQMQAAFQDAKDEMGAAFMPVLTTLMGSLTGLANDLLPVIIPLVEGFADSILVVFDALSPLLPIITTFADKMAIVFDSFMGGDIGAATAVFGAAMKEFSASLSEILPDLVLFGMDILFGIIEGIIASLPALFDAGLQIVMSLAETFMTLLPDIMTTGIDILLALIDGISSMLPMLIPMAIQIIINLYTALIGKLPDIIQAGIELLLALVDGILNALPELIAAIPELIITFVTAIVGALPEILVAGIEILLALIDGIVEAIPEIASAIPQVIIAIVEAVISALPQIIGAGVEIIGALIEGIISSISEILKALPQIWDALVGWFKDKDWGQIGKDIIGGIGEGITGAWETIKKAFGNLLEGLPDWAKKLLGIGSPSKVFAEIGSHIPEGLALGIKVTADLPEKELKSLSMDLAPVVGDLSLLDGGVLSTKDIQSGQSRMVTNNFNLTMPTSSNPEDVAIAFDLLKAFGGV